MEVKPKLAGACGEGEQSSRDVLGVAAQCSVVQGEEDKVEGGVGASVAAMFGELANKRVDSQSEQERAEWVTGHLVAPPRRKG